MYTCFSRMSKRPIASGGWGPGPVAHSPRQTAFSKDLGVIGFEADNRQLSLHRQRAVGSDLDQQFLMNACSRHLIGSPAFSLHSSSDGPKYGFSSHIPPAPPEAMPMPMALPELSGQLATFNNLEELSVGVHQLVVDSASYWYQAQVQGTLNRSCFVFTRTKLHTGTFNNRHPPIGLEALLPSDFIQAVRGRGNRPKLWRDADPLLSVEEGVVNVVFICRIDASSAFISWIEPPGLNLTGLSMARFHGLEGVDLGQGSSPGENLCAWISIACLLFLMYCPDRGLHTITTDAFRPSIWGLASLLKRLSKEALGHPLVLFDLFERMAMAGPGVGSTNKLQATLLDILTSASGTRYELMNSNQGSALRLHPNLSHLTNLAPSERPDADHTRSVCTQLLAVLVPANVASGGAQAVTPTPSNVVKAFHQHVLRDYEANRTCNTLSLTPVADFLRLGNIANLLIASGRGHTISLSGALKSPFSLLPVMMILMESSQHFVPTVGFNQALRMQVPGGTEVDDRRQVIQFTWDAANAADGTSSRWLPAEVASPALPRPHAAATPRPPQTAVPAATVVALAHPADGQAASTGSASALAKPTSPTALAKGTPVSTITILRRPPTPLPPSLPVADVVPAPPITTSSPPFAAKLAKLGVAVTLSGSRSTTAPEDTPPSHSPFATEAPAKDTPVGGWERISATGCQAIQLLAEHGYRAGDIGKLAQVIEKLVQSIPEVLVCEGFYFRGSMHTDGALDGAGILRDAELNRRIYGFFHRKRPVVRGAYCEIHDMGNGTWYAGEAHENSSSGYGTMTSGNTRYEGDFLDGLVDGTGTIYVDGVAQYHGKFEYGHFVSGRDKGDPALQPTGAGRGLVFVAPPKGRNLSVWLRSAAQSEVSSPPRDREAPTPTTTTSPSTSADTPAPHAQGASTDTQTSTSATTPAPKSTTPTQWSEDVDEETDFVALRLDLENRESRTASPAGGDGRAESPAPRANTTAAARVAAATLKEAQSQWRRPTVLTTSPAPMTPPVIQPHELEAVQPSVSGERRRGPERKRRRTRPHGSRGRQHADGAPVFARLSARAPFRPALVSRLSGSQYFIRFVNESGVATSGPDAAVEALHTRHVAGGPSPPPPLCEWCKEVPAQSLRHAFCAECSAKPVNFCVDCGKCVTSSNANLKRCHACERRKVRAFCAKPDCAAPFWAGRSNANARDGVPATTLCLKCRGETLTWSRPCRSCRNLFTGTPQQRVCPSCLNDWPPVPPPQPQRPVVPNARPHNRFAQLQEEDESAESGEQPLDGGTASAPAPDGRLPTKTGTLSRLAFRKKKKKRKQRQAKKFAARVAATLSPPAPADNLSEPSAAIDTATGTGAATSTATSTAKSTATAPAMAATQTATAPTAKHNVHRGRLEAAICSDHPLSSVVRAAPALFTLAASPGPYYWNITREELDEQVVLHRSDGSCFKPSASDDLVKLALNLACMVEDNASEANARNLQQMAQQVAVEEANAKLLSADQSILRLTSALGEANACVARARDESAALAVRLETLEGMLASRTAPSDAVQTEMPAPAIAQAPLDVLSRIMERLEALEQAADVQRRARESQQPSVGPHQPHWAPVPFPFQHFGPMSGYNPYPYRVNHYPAQPLGGPVGFW